MAFEIYGRICVGGLLRPEAIVALNASFLASLGATPETPAEEVFRALRNDTPKHKLFEPDRVRYERAYEAFVDQQWDIDMALGGVSRDGLLDVRKGFIFVGVRVEQFEMTVDVLPRGAAMPEKPQWLRKGDLSAGSDLGKTLGPEARKPWDHASRSYQRAAKDILKDAIARTKRLAVSNAHDIDWALCRWIVEDTDPSVAARHGRER